MWMVPIRLDMTTTRTTHANELTQYSLLDVLAVATGVTVTLLTVMVALTYLDVAVGLLLGAVAVAAVNHVRAHLHKAAATLAREDSRDDLTIQADTRSVSYDAD